MESTLAILVPEAEGLVQPFRIRYDPSAKVGMPAHITLLYPFKPPDEIDAVVLDTLRHCFFRFPAFKFSLRTINQFVGETLYLVPVAGSASSAGFSSNGLLICIMGSRFSLGPSTALKLPSAVRSTRMRLFDRAANNRIDRAGHPERGDLRGLVSGVRS